MGHRNWIVFSGVTWLGIGGFLLFKGLRLITEAVLIQGSLCFQLQSISGSPQGGAVVLIVAALIIGFLKGRFVFAKTVQKMVARIASLSVPIRFTAVYTPSYWILIGCMMALGFLFRWLPIPLDLRGFLDVAIGSALINGSFLYFRSA